ncbi:hypothetical protein H4R35_003512 [Dimargaris xerosporica]|nr:hypothetical protein H4R35_003512 [Dimargaris xerosporica]
MRSTAALQDTLASLEKSSRADPLLPSSPRTPPPLNHSWLLDLPPNTQSFGSLASNNRYSCVDVIQKPNLTYDLRRYSTASAVHQSPQRQLEEALDAFPIPNASYIRTSSEATLHPLSPGSPVRLPPPVVAAPAAAPIHHDYYPHHQLPFPHLSLTLPSPTHMAPGRSCSETRSPSTDPSFCNEFTPSPGAHTPVAEASAVQGALSPTSTLSHKRISSILHDKLPLDGKTATPHHDAEAAEPADNNRHSKRTASGGGGSRLPWTSFKLTTHSSVSAAHCSTASSHRSSTFARTRSHDLAHSPTSTVDEKLSYTLPSPRNRCTLEFPASFMYLPGDSEPENSKVII